MTQASDEAELNRAIEHKLDVAYRLQRKSWDRVYTAVMDAKEAGWSNQDIGYVIGMTEGGVRMMVKRNNGRMYLERGNR